MKSIRPILFSVAALVLSMAQSAHAGRPLTVDDANVNDPGAGHVEAWFARMPGHANTWNVAPAYSPIKDLEVSAILTRDTSENLSTSAIQGKWRITASQPDGCNFGLVAGISHRDNGGGNTPYLNALATCNHKGGALHMNLGLSHPDNEKTLTNWGVAYEREMSGGITGHIEYFGLENGKPTAQVGLRKDIMPGLQLDGTVGRSDGDVVFSLGMKNRFDACPEFCS